MYIIETTVGFKEGKDKDDNPTSDPIVLTVEIKEPEFDEYAGALMAMQKPSGAISQIEGGRFILESCCSKGLEELTKDTKAYVGVCLDVYHNVLSLFQSEVKKK